MPAKPARPTGSEATKVGRNSRRAGEAGPPDRERSDEGRAEQQTRRRSRPDALLTPKALGRHSHSIVPGGLLVMSYATRLTPATSLMMRLDMRSSRS